MALQPVTHRSLVDQVFDQVQRQILDGDLSPGQSMPSERDLIGVLGVNRQAVREALKRLAQAGLVDIQHGGRTTVTDWRYSASLDLLPRLVVRSTGAIDVAVVRSIMEFRLLVGPDVAARCAERATADVVARLQELQGAYDAVDAGSGLIDLAPLDTALWNTLVDGADNIAYRLAYNALRAEYVAVEDAMRDVLEDELRALDAAPSPHLPCARRPCGRGEDRGPRAARHRHRVGRGRVGRHQCVRIQISEGDQMTATRKLHGGDASVDAGTDGFRAVPTNQPQAGASLGEIVRFFFTRPSPLIITTSFVLALAARFAVGRWGGWDLAIPVIVVALEPFVEWLIHVRILHRKPRKLGRFTIDSYTARKHRAHHRNPKDLRALMVPGSTLAALIPLAVAAAVVLMKAPQAAMLLASGFGMLLWYEWVHYLIHAP